MSLKSIRAAYRVMLAEQQIHVADASYVEDPTWDITLDHYGSLADKKLYRKTYKVRAASHDQAVKYIVGLVGGRYIGGGYENASGEQPAASGDGGGGGD